MTQEPEDRLAWLASTIEEAIRLGLMQPAHLLAHVTPEVLAERLPRELMVKVFASAFSTGKLTPEGILSVAPPATLVRHVAPAILWTAVRATAERNQLAGALPSGPTAPRTWLGQILSDGASRGLITPAEVLKHVPPSSFVAEAPAAVVAELLALGLSQPTFDATLILSRLTPRVLSEHIATQRLWALCDETAQTAFGLDGGTTG